MKCHRKLNFKTEQHDSLRNNGLVPSERHIKASTVFDSDPALDSGQTATTAQRSAGDLRLSGRAALPAGKEHYKVGSETPNTAVLPSAIVTAKLPKLRMFYVSPKAEQLYSIPDVWWYGGHPGRELQR